MKFIISIISLYFSIETISYGIFEYKEKNKLGAIVIYIIATITLIAPNVIIYFR